MLRSIHAVTILLFVQLVWFAAPIAYAEIIPFTGNVTSEYATEIDAFLVEQNDALQALVSTVESSNPAALGYYAELGPDTVANLFIVANLSDPGIQLDSVLFALNSSLASAFFDTADGAPGVDPSLRVLPVSGVADTGLTGIVGGAPANDGSQFLALSFNDFDAGESLVFVGDLDDNSASREDVSGIEFSGSLMFGVFSDGTVSQTLAGVALPLPSTPASDAFVLLVVPEPASTALVGWAGVWLLSVAVRRRT